MKSKSKVVIGCTIASALVLCGAFLFATSKVVESAGLGPDVCLTLRVVDDCGQPVPDAECEGWIYLDGAPDDGKSYCATTDKNGIAWVRGRCNVDISVSVHKDTYYDSDSKVDVTKMAWDAASGRRRTDQVNIEQTVRLRRIKKPVAGGSRFISQKIPSYGTWLGYDMELADWTKPNGKGLHADMLLKFTAREVSGSDFGYKMEISFTNNPYAGVYKREKDGFSAFKYDYSADTNATFASTIEFETVYNRDVTRRKWNVLDENSYLVFRTRTSVDSEGKLVSAHYGWIAGHWTGHWMFQQSHEIILPGVFFNQKPNDANLEEDVSQSIDKRF